MKRDLVKGWSMCGVKVVNVERSNHSRCRF